MKDGTAPAETEPDTSARATARPPLIREFLLVAGLFLVYKLGRQLAIGHTPGALHGDAPVHLANTCYATVHFPATAAFLVWMYLRRPAHYVWARRVLAAVTSAALVLPFTFPLSPPRMLTGTGLVDIARIYGPSVYGPPTSDHLSNQYAAMPSLHFGWALMVAVGLIVATRSRWRRLWLLHPLVTLMVIVGTENHYWLDAIVATAMLAAALGVIHPPHRTTSTAGRGTAHLTPQETVLVGAGR